MAKRFIDSGLFDDDWFMDLSKEGKILWLYSITKCDHAGILKLNIKLCKVQTGINNIETVIKELGNRLVRVNEQLLFVPKFVVYQYPGFPDCKFPAARSAIKTLEKYQLIQDGKLTVAKELPNSYGNGNGNGNSNGNGKEEKKVLNFSFDQFWDLYDKKVGSTDKVEKKWSLLSDNDRENIMKYIPKYLAAQPNKQFRKNPETFLNNKSWNDEIIDSSRTEGTIGRRVKRVNQLWGRGPAAAEMNYTEPESF